MSLKGIPDPNAIRDPATRAWAIAITERLRTALGQIGDFEDRMAKVGELKDIGAVGIERLTDLFRKPITEAAELVDRTPPINAPANQYNAAIVFDASAGSAIGVHTLLLTLPQGAYITFGWIDVDTTFTSATDAATIAIGVETDDPTGIVSAIAISASSNPWDAGTKPTSQTGNAANFTERTTAARSIIVTVAGEALTAGRFTLNVYYSIGG